MHLTHQDQTTVDWVLAGSLIGGAYAWHVDMVEVNQYLAFAGGLVGLVLAGARLYFFLREKWNERTGVDPKG